MKLGFAIALPLVAVCALLSGCTSQRAPEEIVVKLNSIQSEVNTGRAAIVGTTESLKALRDTNAAGIKPMFDAYSKSVTDLQAKAGGVGLVMDSASANADKYFAKWGDEIKQISDNELRTSAESRQAAVLAKYQEIQAKIVTVRSSFRPYMGKLQDVNKFLSTDTTPAGRAAAMPTIREAIDLAGPVLKDINSLNASIDKVVGK